MYMPPAFHEKDPDVLWDIVRSHPLGLLISHGDDEIIANQVPFEVIREGDQTKLCAHIARANGQWKNLDGQNVLVVFQGANAYVSPQWYPSKREHGRVVPTWNYAVLQVRGRARVIDDRDWLLAQVQRLTNQHEKRVKQGSPWQVSDAPEDYIQSQLKGIVGMEIAVTAITGKLKASQNRNAADRAGVIAGLEKLDGEDNHAIAGLLPRSKN
jgi:transcriptional regulator